MHALKHLKNELDLIESFLSLHPSHSLQHSDRNIEEVHLFHPVHLNGRAIEGFLWAPNADDVQYEIDMGRSGVPSVEIIMGSGNEAADIARVKAEIPRLFKTAKRRKADFEKKKKGGGGKGKKGYYLEVGIAKKQALLNFENALKNGIGSSDFIDFCVPRNFKMTYFKGANQKK